MKMLVKLPHSHYGRLLGCVDRRAARLEAHMCDFKARARVREERFWSE